MKTPHGKDLLKIGLQYYAYMQQNFTVYIQSIVQYIVHTLISVPVCTRTVTIYCIMYLHLFTRSCMNCTDLLPNVNMYMYSTYMNFIYSVLLKYTFC